MTLNYPTEQQIDLWYGGLNDFYEYNFSVFMKAFYIQIINDYESIETDIL